MDPVTKTWKNVVLADASLEFDKQELEAKKQRLSEKLKELNSKIGDALSESAELRLQIESEEKCSQSLASSVLLLKESKNSLLKEKNDLLKQLELQQIKNREDKKQQDATLSFYTSTYEQNLSQFHEFPLVRKKLNLEIETKKREIELRTKENELRELRSGIKQFVEINERRFQVNFIKIAQAYMNLKAEVQKNQELRRKLDELVKKADGSKEDQEVVRAQKSVRTVPVTPFVRGTRDLSAPTMSFRRLQDISLSFSPSNSNLKLQLQELRREREAESTLNFSFSNTQSISETPNPRTVTSKIPVFDRRSNVASPVINDVGHGKKSSQTNGIRNFTKPSEIMSPRNSKIPISNSPLYAKQELTFDRPKTTTPLKRNGSSQALSALSNVSRSCISVAPRRVPSAVQRPVVPPPNRANFDSPKRKLDVKSLKNKEHPQKLLRNGSFPPSKHGNEQRVCHEVSTTSRQFRQSGESNHEPKDIRKWMDTMEGSYENDPETDRDNSHHEPGSLNKTYSVADIVMINQEEEASFGSSTPINPVQNFDTFQVNGCQSSNAACENRVDETVSKYFNEISDKENAPPGGTIQKITPTDPNLQDEDDEMMPHEDMDEERSYDVEENDDQFGNYSFVVSPPRSTSPPKIDAGISDAPEKNFFEHYNKDKNSSGSEEKNTKTGFASDSFCFSSKPKGKKTTNLFGF